MSDAYGSIPYLSSVVSREATLDSVLSDASEGMEEPLQHNAPRTEQAREPRLR
jgi:hypothetical protein